MNAESLGYGSFIQAEWRAKMKMICPKLITCERCLYVFCPHGGKHDHLKQCDENGTNCDCPKCVPVEEV